MTQACNTRITGFYQNVLEFKSTYLVVASVSPLDSRRRLCEIYKTISLVILSSSCHVLLVAHILLVLKEKMYSLS